MGCFFKVACRIKSYSTWTTKNIISSHYFSKKPVLCSNIKGKWNTWDWKYIICVFKFLRQIWCNFTKKFCLSRAPSLYRINFSVYFSIQYTHIKRIFKTVSHFSYFSAVFEKSANFSRPELSFNYILKECFISKDLQTIWKKADIVLITFCSSCTTENFKAIL